VPQQPKSSSTGFLSGALRRLSSSSTTSQGKSPTTGSSQGTIAPRMTLNIDKDRERCQIKELNQGKLRRVAFNVDVEIAGVSTHIPEDDVDADGMALDKRATARGEGEALKHPELAEGQTLGASTRANNAGMWSSMSMTEDDWGTPPRSPKVPGGQTMGQKDSKRSMPPAISSIAKKTGLNQPKLGRRKDAFNDFDDDWGEDLKKTAAKRGGPGDKIQAGEHDILKHLSGMDDEWGSKARTSSTKLKKTRTGSAGNGMFDSFALDESDFDDAPKRNRSVSESSQRRGSGNSTAEPKRDMMAVLADDDWSDQKDSPAQGGTPTKRPSPTKGSPIKGSPAGPRPQTQPTAANNVEQRSSRSPKSALGRAQSSPAPLSLGQAGMPQGQPKVSEGAPVKSLLQAGQLVAPEDLPSRGTSASPAGTRPQDRPTTDPLRIYRRCCQLREAPVLKRISEQLSKLENFNEGIVGTLNLNKSRMQATDMVCLSDFLAIVPVKRLLLEDANIPDDGLRQILAGLLATKTPEVAKRRRGRTSPTRSRNTGGRSNPGVIEKLSLKGNRKITEEGWKHLCLFINMSNSIRSIDVSLCPFPKPAFGSESSARTIDDIFCKALVERPAGNQLYELLMADCGLTTQQVERVTRAASRGLERLGLANNNLTEEGLGFVARYVHTGSCHGIDLGGNDLRGKTHVFAKGLHERLLALSVANCNLLPADLDQLLPALAALPDLRLLDMSHNKQLFTGGNGTATMAALRKQIPRFKLLKRIHLADCSMTPEHVIHIAEILPECRNLAHINVLENPAIKAVISDGADQTHQEEACALFASLMTAARLSKTLVCVDIDVPGPTASEVVKALARQVVAYCLRNIEAFTEADAVTFADAAAALPDIDKSNDSGIELLQHFLGHQDAAAHDTIGKAATEDYFVGGTGVVKALSYILSASQSGNVEYSRPGTPKDALESELGKAQAKDMSRTLLESARKYRAGLQPVLVRETNANNIDVLRKWAGSRVLPHVLTISQVVLPSSTKLFAVSSSVSSSNIPKLDLSPAAQTRQQTKSWSKRPHPPSAAPHPSTASAPSHIAPVAKATFPTLAVPPNGATPTPSSSTPPPATTLSITTLPTPPASPAADPKSTSTTANSSPKKATCTDSGSVSAAKSSRPLASQIICTTHSRPVSIRHILLHCVRSMRPGVEMSSDGWWCSRAWRRRLP